MAHGLWSTNAAYRAEVSRCLDDVAPANQAKMRHRLLRSGYADVQSILRDEMQAYMAGNGELLDADHASVAPIAKRIGDIFDAYKDGKLMEVPRGARVCAAAGQLLEARLTVLAAGTVRFCVTVF